MSKHIAIKDFRDMLVDLNERVWLEKSTVIAIIKSMADLPRIDIVHCEECKYKWICNHSVQHTTRETSSTTIGNKSVYFCSYGERIEE